MGAFFSIPVGLPITAKLTWSTTVKPAARWAARLPANFTTRRARASALALLVLEVQEPLGADRPARDQ